MIRKVRFFSIADFEEEELWLREQRENDAEIFSDPASKVDMIRHLIQTRMLPLLAIFLCCILPNWARLVLDQAGRMEQILGMAFTGLLLLYVYLLLYCAIKLRTLRKKYARS